MTRLYLYGAILAASTVAGGYLYLDGRKDAKRAIEATQNEARIDDIKAARTRQNETGNLSDDDLRDSLRGRVQPAGPQ